MTGTTDPQFLCDVGDCFHLGFYRSEGGTVQAARLPKGWTGPVSMLGARGELRLAPRYFRSVSWRAGGISPPSAEQRNRVVQHSGAYAPRSPLDMMVNSRSGGRHEYRRAARARTRRTGAPDREHARPAGVAAGERRRRARRHAVEPPAVEGRAARPEGAPLRETLHRRARPEARRTEHGSSRQGAREVGSRHALTGSVRAGVGRHPARPRHPPVRRATRGRRGHALRRAGRTRHRGRQDRQRVVARRT